MVIRTFTYVFAGAAAALLLLASCSKADAPVINDAVTLSSPDGQLTASVGVSAKGEPCYRLERAGAEVVKPSRLGFVLAKGTDSIEEDLLLEEEPFREEPISASEEVHQEALSDYDTGKESEYRDVEELAAEVPDLTEDADEPEKPSSEEE